MTADRLQVFCDMLCGPGFLQQKECGYILGFILCYCDLLISHYPRDYNKTFFLYHWCAYCPQLCWGKEPLCLLAIHVLSFVLLPILN